MSVRVLTHAGTLELGRPPRNAPQCEASGCHDGAQLELDVPTAVRGLGRLRLIDGQTRTVRVCARHLADYVARGITA